MNNNVLNVLVKRDINNNPIYIRTVISGVWSKKKRVFVLLHGYGGAGPLYFKIFKDLSTHFNLISFDMIGMGGSSRPDDFKTNFTPE